MPSLKTLLTRFRRVGSTEPVLKLLIVLSLTGPAATLVLTTVQSRALLLDGATARAAGTSDLLAQHASSAFDAYNLAFGRIEEHLAQREAMPGEEALHAYLATIDRGMKSIEGLVLIGPDWVPLAHSRYYPVPKVYVGDRDYIRNLQHGGGTGRDRAGDIAGRAGLVVGAPVASRYSGKSVLVAARARHDAAGRPNGALVVSLAPGYFGAFYDTLALSDRDRVALVRADSQVLVQKQAGTVQALIDPEAPSRADILPVAATSADAPPRLAEGTRDHVSAIDAIRRISGLRKLDGYPVFVELGYSVDAILEPWRRQLALNAALAALATLLLYGAGRLALSKVRAESALQAVAVAETRRLAAVEAALAQSQKMETFGQITGGLAHDFNNLLNVVMINLELATRRLGDAPDKGVAPADSAKLASYLDGATQGAERGVALTRRLLVFAHRQEEETVELRVSDLVFGMRDLLGQAVGSRVRITLDCPTSLPPVRTDPNALETALLNLVVNAREAMPEGGRVHIAARAEREGDGPDAGSFVVLSVKDTGAGMDAAMLSRAVEPFFTTKAAGTGSGLGLATVDRYAAQAGGRFRIESTPGLGTLAEIWLPAA